MSDEMIPMTEEAAEAGRTFTERVSVTGSDLIETVQSLLREAAVRKITIQDKDGRTLVEIPLYAGIAGAIVLGSATVLALIAAWFAQVSILIERDRASDTGQRSAVGEAMERAAGSAQSAASQVVGGVSAIFGSAARGAGDAARRMADALDARLSGAASTADEAAAKVGATASDAAAKTGELADMAAAKVGEMADMTASKAASAAEAVGAAADDAAAKTGELAGMAAAKAGTAAGAMSDKAHDAADAIGEAAEAADERQCAAMTKAGTRCKRSALPGSAYCSVHQVA